MLNLSYSREFEEEADSYALSYMQQSDINPQHFLCIMQLLDQSHEKKLSVPELLSTHPATQARLQRFQEAGLSNENSIECVLDEKLNHEEHGDSRAQ